MATNAVNTANAVLDDAHVGDIRGALGTIAVDDVAGRSSASAKLKTLLAIVGPGLIVMVGDNDAGAFSTYGQAGQNYGTHLLAAVVIIASAMTGSFRRFERIAMVFCAGSLLLIPVYLLAHPPASQMA